MPTTDEHNAWLRTMLEAELLCARIEMEGMIAENQQRFHSGFSPAYVEEDFLKIIKDHGIGYNDVKVKFLELF